MASQLSWQSVGLKIPASLVRIRQRPHNKSGWPSGQALVCKTSYIGSNPVPDSNIKYNVLWDILGQNDLLREYLWNEWKYNVHKRYLKYFDEWYENITEEQRQFFETYRNGNKTLQFIEIYLVVNQLALGCRIWNADNVGSSPIYQT